MENKESKPKIASSLKRTAIIRKVESPAFVRKTSQIDPVKTPPKEEQPQQEKRFVPTAQPPIPKFTPTGQPLPKPVFNKPPDQDKTLPPNKPPLPKPVFNKPPLPKPVFNKPPDQDKTLPPNKPPLPKPVFNKPPDQDKTLPPNKPPLPKPVFNKPPDLNKSVPTAKPPLPKPAPVSQPQELQEPVPTAQMSAKKPIAEAQLEPEGAPATDTQPAEEQQLPKIIIITDDEYQVREIRPEELRLTFGNNPEPHSLDIQIEDPEVAPLQLVAIRMVNEFLLINCDMSNKTTFDGILSEQCTVSYTERRIIKMGSYHLIFIGPLYTPPKSSSGKKPKLLISDLEKMAKSRSFDNTESIKLKKDMFKKHVGIKDKGDAGFIVECNKRTARSQGDPLLVGSDEKCDLQVPHKSVSPFHAVVYINSEGLYIEPIYHSKIKLNEKNITSPVMIRDTEMSLQIGSFIHPAPTFILKITQEGDINALCQNAKLHSPSYKNFVFNAVANSEAESFLLDRYGLPQVIGRTSDADIVIADSAISRRHAELIPQGKWLTVRDLGSSNGTFANDRQVELDRVYPGEILLTGNSSFLITFG